MSDETGSEAADRSDGTAPPDPADSVEGSDQSDPAEASDPTGEGETTAGDRFTAADRVARVPPSGIRAFFEVAEAHDDVVSLGVGEPDFSAPWPARSAAVASLERGRTSYTANRGTAELRRAIAGRVERYGHAYDPDEEVLVTTGASEAVDLAFRAFVDPGDTVALPTPTYVSYEPGVTFAGGDPLAVPTYHEDDWALTPEALAEAGADEAEMLVLCYPNNPTGATMSADELDAVAAFCVDNDLLVVSDEIYAALTYDGDHESVATRPGMRERTVVINGFSKAYAMTGLRLGYALAPPGAIEAMTTVHQYGMLSAPTTAQHAAVAAIERCDDEVARMRREYDRRRRYLTARLRELGLAVAEPSGAFYAFPRVTDVAPDGDDEAFATDLLDEVGVAAVPGSAFGSGGAGHLRLSYATGMGELKEATRRLERYLDGR
ncbi:pyridoxal phosphate-dependent aminotransferase [Candidatus Halobonum tyrrellensis]|uniref:Aminotransferase n=1 Tax=Candidatus Halobonum tyrrellensis G22 TaxID=1324957 RepID=V4HGD6_9EURY|nr:aminotransferase class I/II-fold pyridoxal phosphate-dependent enzyme [Candidatus Halobonum tyrrellensis]ESP89178.1 PLP-dependent aminotransferase (aspartate aminotransferase) [Candidatus Halobonum tyrrellensis G22]